MQIKHIDLCKWITHYCLLVLLDTITMNPISEFKNKRKAKTVNTLDDGYNVYLAAV